ncbi:hypothetical protein [Rhodococcus zopfii]|uniref:hypothetical protein n=1 Tax=Rhodococcus zopfii TaxID=43772 RepID=UPI0009323CB7|nr:hypothetical protein [Rhodococcus zopfii]
MPLPIVQFSYLGALYSPFSGGMIQPVEDGCIEEEPTLLFVYDGNVREWVYISARVTDNLPESLPEDAETVEDLDATELAEVLDIPGGIVMAVDFDWNGIVYFGVAPVESTDQDA